jgi:hypothetical protein
MLTKNIATLRFAAAPACAAPDRQPALPETNMKRLFVNTKKQKRKDTKFLYILCTFALSCLRAFAPSRLRPFMPSRLRPFAP